jgi:hypothetical protein
MKRALSLLSLIAIQLLLVTAVSLAEGDYPVKLLTCKELAKSLLKFGELEKDIISTKSQDVDLVYVIHINVLGSHSLLNMFSMEGAHGVEAQYNIDATNYIMEYITKTQEPLIDRCIAICDARLAEEKNALLVSYFIKIKDGLKEEREILKKLMAELPVTPYQVNKKEEK